jgi:hypothetical protein
MMRTTPTIFYASEQIIMRDIYEVIRQKESDLERIQHEIEALRLSAKLLEDGARPSTSVSSNASANLYPSTAPKSQPPTQPTANPAAWASAKQFP